MEDEIKSAMTSPTIMEIAKALASAQGEMSGAKKGSANPFFASKYADLAAVIGAIREPLSKHGIAHTQIPGSDEHGMYLDTILMHASGEWIRGRIRMQIPEKWDKEAKEWVSGDTPQGRGSVISYMRRYSLQAMTGLEAEDDDGNKATGPGEQRRPLPATKPLPKGSYQEAPTVPFPETKAPDNGTKQYSRPAKEAMVTSWREITSHMGTKSGILGKKLGTLIPEAIAMLERKVAEIKSPTKQDSILIAALAMRRAELEKETSLEMLFEKCKALKITLESVVTVNKRMGSKAETFDAIPESEAKALLDDWEGTQAQAFDEMADTLPRGDK